MPVESGPVARADVVLERLTKATDAEAEAFARTLRTERRGERALDNAALTFEYYRVAGRGIRGVVRDEDAYRWVLESLMDRVVSSFCTVRVVDATRDQWIEDYLLGYARLMNDQSFFKLPARQRNAIRKNAEAILQGEKTNFPWEFAKFMAKEAVKGLLVVPAYLGTARDIRLGEQILPATLVLGHVRKRLEAEQLLAVGGGPS